MMRCLGSPLSHYRVAKLGFCCFGFAGRTRTKNKVSCFDRPCLDTPMTRIAYLKGWLCVHSLQHTFKKRKAISSISDGTLQFYNRFFLVKLFTLSNWSVIETNNDLEYEYYHEHLRHRQRRKIPRKWCLKFSKKPNLNCQRSGSTNYW